MAEPDNKNNAAETKISHSGMTLSSLETLAFISEVAVIVFTVLAAIAGAFALHFNSKAGAMKDTDLASFQSDSAAKVAAANVRAEEAKLALEKFKAPRALPIAKFPEFIKRLKPFAGTTCNFAVDGSVEQTQLAAQILSILRSAQWNCINWNEPTFVYSFPNLPTMGQSIASRGVFIQIFDSRLRNAANALAEVLKDSDIGGVLTRVDPPSSGLSDTMHIRIGEKI